MWSLEIMKKRGAWVARSGKLPTFGLGSGHGLRVVRSKIQPHFKIDAGCGTLRFSPCASERVCLHSLSQKKKLIMRKICIYHHALNSISEQK